MKRKDDFKTRYGIERKDAEMTAGLVRGGLVCPKKKCHNIDPTLTRIPMA